MNLEEPIALGRDTFVLHSEEQLHDTIRMLYPNVRQCAGIGIASINDIAWPALVSLHVATPHGAPVAFFHASPQVTLKASTRHQEFSIHMGANQFLTSRLLVWRQKMDRARADIAAGRPISDTDVTEGWSDTAPVDDDVPVAQPLDMSALANILGKTS